MSSENGTPNKYNLTPKDIKRLKVADWDRLKKETWYNNAMKSTGEWYCHLEGAGKGWCGDAIDEFWIGFNKTNNTIDYNFTCWEGMGKYIFNTFYDPKEIENKYDRQIQSKALDWLNRMIDEGILCL